MNEVEEGMSRSRMRWALTGAAVVVLTVLGTVILGRNHHIDFGHFSHPPLYGVWRPVISRFTPIAAAMAIVLAALAWFLTSGHRIPRKWVVLAVVIVSGVAAALAVNMARGNFDLLLRGVTPGSSYATDVDLLQEMGIREFTRRYPELADTLEHHNSKTHPPGALVVMYVLFQVFGSGNTFLIATAIAIIGMCGALAAFAMGKVLGGDRAGLIAALLCVAAPGPLLLSYTAMDAVYATVLSGAAAMFMIAIHRSSTGWAVAAGAFLGLSTFVTYATAFIGIAVGLAVLLQARSVRETLRLLGAAAAGGLLALAMLWLVFGFDLLGSYHRVPGSSRPYDPYWIFGAPTAVLLFAGMPLAVLGVMGFFRKTAGRRGMALPIILFAFMLVWFALPSTFTQLRPGEVERTWAFMYPILAASAAPLVDRWSRDLAPRFGRLLVPALVLVSAGQALLIQTLYDTRF